ncbi:MAG: SLC13 family permease [Phycisphaerales bacterium]
MGFDGWFTLLVIVSMVATLATNRFGTDIVILGALTTLMVFDLVTPYDILSPKEAVSGFANTGVLTVGMLYIVAAGLKESGAMAVLTAKMLGRPSSNFSAQARIIAPVGIMSAFVNNTPIVAMFLPVLSDWSRRYNLSASKLFMPLSFAAILGGLCTLIGTSTNLVVAGLIEEHNKTAPPDAVHQLEPFTMFSITPVGLPVALVGIAYMLVLGRRLLPDRDPKRDPTTTVREYVTAMRVAPSGVAGKTVEQAGLRHLPGLFLSRIERERETVVAVGPDEKLEANDILLFVGALDSVIDLQKIRGLDPVVDGDGPSGIRQLNRLVEVVVSRASPLVGRSIREGAFRTTYNAVVIAVHRHGHKISGKIGDIVLRPGDTLLVEAPKGWADTVKDSDAFHLVSELPEAAAPRHDRAWAAIAILACTVVAMTVFEGATMVVAFAAAGAMIALRCCTGPQARRSVEFPVLVVIAAAFGIGTAMQNSGLAEFLANNVLGFAAGAGTLSLLAAVYITTVVFTSLITNNAAAVLVFPIAISLAESAGMTNFTPVAICIAIGASAEFITPIGYQTNLMVLGPGRYKWLDYTRFGGPLMLLCGAVCVVMAWMLHQ